MSAPFDNYELPPDKQALLDRGRRLEWWSLGFLGTGIVANRPDPSGFPGLSILTNEEVPARLRGESPWLVRDHPLPQLAPTRSGSAGTGPGPIHVQCQAEHSQSQGADGRDQA